MYGGVIVDTKGNNQQICVRLHLDNSVITSDASVRVRKLLVNGNNRRKRKGIEKKKKTKKRKLSVYSSLHARNVPDFPPISAGVVTTHCPGTFGPNAHADSHADCTTKVSSNFAFIFLRSAVEL